MRCADPTPENEERIKAFQHGGMKLEPFQRGMRELAPTVWFIGVEAGPVNLEPRAGTPISWPTTGISGHRPASPVFHWSDAQMETTSAAARAAQRVELLRPARPTSAGIHAARRGARRRAAATHDPHSMNRYHLNHRSSRDRGHPYHARGGC